MDLAREHLLMKREDSRDDYLKARLVAVLLARLKYQSRPRKDSGASSGQAVKENSADQKPPLQPVHAEKHSEKRNL
jgi:hypothetical protein